MLSFTIMKNCERQKRFVEVGQVFSKLTVLSLPPPGRALALSMCLCRCECGKQKNVSLKHLFSGAVRACGCQRGKQGRREKSPNWRGGRRKDANGYVWIYRPIGYENDPRPHILEHVIVMEKSLGRGLKDGETIHHKNGIRDDNRLENLELWAGNHRKGQRVSDLVVWAKEILQRYDRPIVSPCCV